jgi:hypothetical protein
MNNPQKSRNPETLAKTGPEKNFGKQPFQKLISKNLRMGKKFPGFWISGFVSKKLPLLNWSFLP